MPSVISARLLYDIRFTYYCKHPIIILMTCILTKRVIRNRPFERSYRLVTDFSDDCRKKLYTKGGLT